MVDAAAAATAEGKQAGEEKERRIKELEAAVRSLENKLLRVEVNGRARVLNLEKEVATLKESEKQQQVCVCAENGM